MSLNQIINQDQAKPWLDVRFNFLKCASTEVANLECPSLRLPSVDVDSAGDINIANTFNLIDTTAGTLAMTLPTTSKNPLQILVNSGSGANDFTIAAAQHAGTLTYTVPDGESVSCLHDSVGGVWYIISQSAGVTTA